MMTSFMTHFDQKNEIDMIAQYQFYKVLNLQIKYYFKTSTTSKQEKTYYPMR